MLISEAIEFLREKREQGYLTQEMMLEIFRNGDWIEDEHLEMCYFFPEPPKPFEFHCGVEAYHQLNKVLEEFVESEFEKERKIRMN